MRWFLLPALLMACTDVTEPIDINDNEFITTVELTVGGLPVVWEDLEGDGDPTVDDWTIQTGSAIPFSLRFLNRSVDPPEDITAEIIAEADEHQVFFTGDALEVEVTDTDADGLPLGLEGTVTATEIGAHSLEVILRHLPAQDGTAVKIAGLDEEFASGGLDALPGQTDARVVFEADVIAPD